MYKRDCKVHQVHVVLDDSKVADDSRSTQAQNSVSHSFKVDKRCKWQTYDAESSVGAPQHCFLVLNLTRKQ